MRIELTIPGKPVAQGRPRFYRRGNFVVATDPKASKVYKADIQYLAQKHKENNNNAGYVLSAIFITHVISMFDILLSSRNSRVSISPNTNFLSYNNKYKLNGINFSVDLK